jgi:hypothetical protein
MILSPRIEGSLPLRSSPTAFIRAIRARVASGLLAKNDARSRYAISESSGAKVRIHAIDWPTALNVGLNELELDFTHPGRVAYQVRYRRWAAYALGLSGVLGIVGLILLVAFDARGYIASDPWAQVPGLSVDQNLLVAWSMVLFWGFVWPWVLIVLHKRTLRHLVTRIVAEVDESDATNARVN